MQFPKKVLALFLLILSYSVFADDNEEFIKACKEGRLESVKEFLSNGVDINYRSKIDSIFPGSKPYGETGLMNAAQYKKVEVLKYLLDKKADVNICDRVGYTALLYATQNIEINVTTLEIIDLLVKSGSDVNVSENNEGNTPLIFLCQTHSDASKAIQILFNSGKLDLNKKNMSGKTAYVVSQEYSNQPNSSILLQLGAKAEKVLTKEEKYDNFIDTLPQIDAQLMRACRIGNISSMVFAVNNGANINVTDINEFTPLMICVNKKYYDMAKYLLENKASVNSKTKYNVTALIVAASLGDSELIKLLLAYGADKSIKDTTYGFTAYDYAKYNNYVEAMYLLAN